MEICVRFYYIYWAKKYIRKLSQSYTIRKAYANTTSANLYLFHNWKHARWAERETYWLIQII